jgi:hypothetical protein
MALLEVKGEKFNRASYPALLGEKKRTHERAICQAL